MVKNLVQEHIEKFNIKFPIVGIQVRRTDRLARERWVPLERYMDFAEDYYDQLELTESVEKRRVYFATESPELLPEIKSKYPDYEIITNDQASSIAKTWSTRFTTEALLGMLVDLHILALCNYTVCTESSNVCRILSEYHQLKHPDTTNVHKSLDTLYFADYENDRFATAILPHTPSSLVEIEMDVGDPLTLDYKYNQNGMYLAVNGRTKEKGLVPAFKVEISLDTFDAPSFY
jgi:glycoprotein 6-alpha-L-fucosyltransferase